MLRYEAAFHWALKPYTCTTLKLFPCLFAVSHSNHAKDSPTLSPSMQLGTVNERRSETTKKAIFSAALSSSPSSPWEQRLNHTMLLKLSLLVRPSKCCQAEKTTDLPHYCGRWWTVRIERQPSCTIYGMMLGGWFTRHGLRNWALTGEGAVGKMFFVFF